MESGTLKKLSNAYGTEPGLQEIRGTMLDNDCETTWCEYRLDLKLTMNSKPMITELELELSCARTRTLLRPLLSKPDLES